MFSNKYKQKINKDISMFTRHLKQNGQEIPHIFDITDDMEIEREGVSKLVMLDRYAFKDIEKITLTIGDFVVLTVKDDIKWPTRGYGYVTNINLENNEATIKVDDEFIDVLEGKELETGFITRNLDSIEKPLELYYEQIAKRNASGLASVEVDKYKRIESFNKFYKELSEGNFVPAGRVLYGAGSATDVTYFNCYVMPYPKDSRDGLGEHRKEVMEIMSRGGGVGTNGSSLRPKNTLAKGVNGKSSGSVSWLDDIAKLTHLVEQGGSRRGAQMIMLADWHPDIIEFIISKMQNPNVLRFIIDSINDEQIKQLAKNKLKFTPFTQQEIEDMRNLADYYFIKEDWDNEKRIELKLFDGGRYSVNDPEFLTGANISVALTHDFMNAVENDEYYALRFPDTESYNKEQMEVYNNEWHECGDVREWERLGNKVRTYREIKAKELWNLINIAATYSAEPGIFFIDNANDMTNAKAYGQQVVCTNPCGEQPLAPYSVCNLAAVNLANMVNKKTKTVDFDKLINTVKVGVRMQDNVIDATPYFLDKNTKQAKAERRVGLGVMGLADLLIYCEKEYGSHEGNEIIDKIFETISVAAYEESIELAKEKGEFPALTDGTDPSDMFGGYFISKEKREAFINTGFMKKMPTHIRLGILEHGIRNSHLLTIAPTGSTGTMMNVSTGLEPYFSFSYFRSGRLGKFIEVKADILQEYFDKTGIHEIDDPNGTMALPSFFISSMELTPEAHVDVQCIIQNRIDSSISKTVNAPKGYTVEQVEKVYERLWKGGAKGGTVYVDGSRDAQVLSLTNKENEIQDITFIFKENETNEVNEDNIGINPGDTCPACRKGIIEIIAGCSTCTNCKSQLKCDI